MTFPSFDPAQHGEAWEPPEPPPAVVQPPEEEYVPPPEDAIYTDSVEQAARGMRSLLRQGARQFIHYPWADLDQMVGGLLPGELHYVCAFSGNGKTLFMLSLLNEWIESGKRVYFLGLETVAKFLLTQLCCMRNEIAGPEVLTGRAMQRADWPDVRKRLIDTIQYYKDRQLYLSPVEHVGATEVALAYRAAVDLGADVLMIDHVDHISGTTGQLYEESVAINSKLEELAKRHSILTIASSQLNLEAVKGDPLAQYRPPRPDHVKMGNKKRELATSMLGLYRPISSTVTPDQLKNVKAGTMDPRLILTPFQMGCVVMKNRKGGNDGARCLLSTHGYRVNHLLERDRYQDGRVP